MVRFAPSASCHETYALPLCTAIGFLSICNPCLQPEARSNGPDSDVRSFSSGGWYNGDGRIAKAGWAATATSGRAEGSVPDHKVYFQFNDIFE